MALPRPPARAALTPAERFIARVRRRLSALQPEAASAYLRGLRTLAESLDTQQVERELSKAFKEAVTFSGRRIGTDTGSVAEYASTRRAAERLEAFQAELSAAYAHVPANRRTLDIFTEAQRARLLDLEAVYDAHVEANRRLLPLPDLEELAGRLLPDAKIDAAFSRFRAVTQGAVGDGVMYFARDVPGAQRFDVNVNFGVLQPRVVEAIRTMDDRVTERLRGEVRASYRGIMEQAYVEGIGPRQAAGRVRHLLGLAPNELRQVANFRAALEGKDGRDWRTYTARDKRYDRTIARALQGGGLTPERIDAMVEAYARKRLALSAEAHARTTMLNASKLAQQASWQTAVDQGIIGSLLSKEWVTVGDSRVRPDHVDMRGEVAAFDQPYSNGQVVPGESEWNCRCWSRIFARRA